MQTQEKITVELRRKGSKYYILVRFAQQGRYAEVRSRTFSLDLIRRVQSTLRSRLEEMYESVSTPMMEVDTNCRARSILRKFSRWFLNQIFEEDPRDRLIECLRAMRDRGIEQLLARNKPVGIIEYIGDVGHALPIEHIFLGMDTDSPPESAGSAAELSKWLAGFVGFAFDVRRIPIEDDDLHPRDIHPQDILRITSRSESRLGVRIYPLDKLPRVPVERDFLIRENSHVFDAKDCDLGSSQEQAVMAVGRGLGESCGPPVHHFACHFSPMPQDGRPGSHFQLGSGDHSFGVELYDIVAEHRERCSDSWVAFLNACETGGSTTYDLGGLVPDFFRLFHAACLIGPEYRVRDDFACEFGRMFYGYWLRHRDLGLALFKARWFFVNRYSNPMGLFYVYFATKRVVLDGERQYVFL